MSQARKPVRRTNSGRPVFRDSPEPSDSSESLGSEESSSSKPKKVETKNATLSKDKEKPFSSSSITATTTQTASSSNQTRVAASTAPIKVRLLETITDKADEISQQLPPGIEEKFNRLLKADTFKRNELKKLLSFGKKKRDTVGLNRELISATLISYLTQGGTIKDAETFKKALMNKPEADITATLNSLALKTFNIPVTEFTSAQSLRFLVQDLLAVNGLSSEVMSLIANISKESPVLANRLNILAGTEKFGAVATGITAFIAKRAQNDFLMADLKSPLKLVGLPTEEELGFKPKFHFKLDGNTYNTAKANALKLQKKGFMDKLQFDDQSTTVHMGYAFQTFQDIYGGLKNSIDGLADDNRIELRDAAFKLERLFSGLPISSLSKLPPENTPQAMYVEMVFGNPKYQDQRQETRFEAVFDMYAIYNDFDFVKYDKFFSLEKRQEIAKALKNKLLPVQMELLLNNYPGFAISDVHDRPEMKQILFDNLEVLKKLNVKLIGIEHLRADFDDLLVEYANSPKNEPMPEDLAAILNNLDNPGGKYKSNSEELYGKGKQPKFFTEIVKKAKKLGIQIVPLDVENNQTPPVPSAYHFEIRHGAMNMVAEKLLAQKKEKINFDKKTDKFVLLTGAAHNNTHVGLTHGMPGFAQTLSIPAVRVNIESPFSYIGTKANSNPVELYLTLDEEDTRKRRPPTPDSPQ